MEPGVNPWEARPAIKVRVKELTEQKLFKVNGKKNTTYQNLGDVTQVAISKREGSKCQH